MGSSLEVLALLFTAKLHCQHHGTHEEGHEGYEGNEEGHEGHEGEEGNEEEGHEESTSGRRSGCCTDEESHESDEGHEGDEGNESDEVSASGSDARLDFKVRLAHSCDASVV